MTTFYEAQDINGNKWPNWKVEEITETAREKLIRAFNGIFTASGNLMYPGTPYKGFPLSDDTPAYLIHNEKFKLLFTELTARKSRRCTNEYCQLSLAYTEATGFPALTGHGMGRVMHVVYWDFADPDRAAIYRIDVPTKLSRAATDFDDHDKVEPFEDIWDPDNEFLTSTVPSRGRTIRAVTGGTSLGGWVHSTKDAQDRYVRPTLRKLLREYE
jgi:hypothetical protein